MARKVLGGWLILGAILMTGVASSAGLRWPVQLDESGDLLVVAVVLGGWAVGYAVAARFVIMDAVRLARRRDLDGLQRAANFVKLIAIPYFAMNFLTLTLLTGVAASWFGDLDRPEAAPGGLVVALLFVLFTYLVMLPTSAYGVAGLMLLKESRDIGSAFFGINLVLHLLFVVDVLSGILVVEKARHLLGRSRAPSVFSRHLLTGVVLLGSVLASVWLVLVVIALVDDAEVGLVDGVAASLSLASPLEFALLVLVPVVPLITFRTAVRHYLRGDLDELRRAARTVKLLAIPMFIQNFVVCVIIVLAATIFPVIATRGIIIMAFPILGAFTAAATAVVVAGTYLMMLTTSIYGVACLALMLRQRTAGRVFCILNLLLHLTFVLDILSALLVAHHAGKVLKARNRPVRTALPQSATPV